MQILSEFFSYWDAPALIFGSNDCLWSKVYVVSLSWPLETRYKLILWTSVITGQN